LIRRGAAKRLIAPNPRRDDGDFVEGVYAALLDRKPERVVACRRSTSCAPASTAVVSSSGSRRRTGRAGVGSTPASSLGFRRVRFRGRTPSYAPPGV
jgi:hypothetical protein